MVARAMLTMGENLITVDIKGLSRSTEYNTTMLLSDGTQMTVHPKDISVYDSTSLPAMEMEEVMNPTYIPFTGIEAEETHIDRALIQKGNKQTVVKVKDFQFRDRSYYMITLEDGMPITVHPEAVKFFDSKSKIMQQYQDRFISNKRFKRQPNADIDEFVYSL